MEDKKEDENFDDLDFDDLDDADDFDESWDDFDEADDGNAGDEPEAETPSDSESVADESPKKAKKKGGLFNLAVIGIAVLGGGALVLAQFSTRAGKGESRIRQRNERYTGR